MISISLVGIILLTISSWLLGVMTYLNDRRQATNRIFAILCITSGIYGLVNYLADHDPSHGLLWTRSVFFFTTYLLYLAVAFVATFPRRQVSKYTLQLLLIPVVAISIVALLPGFVPRVNFENGVTEVVTGSFYYLFVAYFVIAFGSVMLLVARSYRVSNRLERQRVGLILYALILTTALIALTNLVLPIIQGTNQWAELASYFLIIFIAASYYAIVRQRIFNLRLVAVRGSAYVLLVSVMAVAYIGAVTALSDLLVSDKTNTTFQTIISTALAVILAFSFQSLLKLFNRLTDTIFYRNRYDTQEVLANFSTVLVRELDLETLMRRSLVTICHDLDVNYAQLIIFKDDRVDRVEHVGPLPERLMVAPQLKLLDKALVVVDELEDGERKRLLEEHGLRLSALLRKPGNTIGYLLLGDKLSGDVYTQQDVNVIGIMAKELAVAISNAQAYLEIQEFASTLQERINHATGRLRVANRHLKELDKVKDEFISMASHQLRTPLTTIKGYLSMMLEGDAGELTATQREFADYAFTSSDHMVHLISDLLDVSRLSAGRFIIQPKEIDLVKLVNEEVDQLRQRAESKKIELHLVLPAAPLPHLMLDEVKTRQVIMNFIDNAIYYTKEGSVTILLNQKAGVIRFEVRDTGIGVPESAKKHLFTKFYRADNAQTTRPDGTGLGIYLAKRVIEDQGGTIVFSSTENKGSIFGFELPLVPAKASSPKTKALHG